MYLIAGIMFLVKVYLLQPMMLNLVASTLWFASTSSDLIYDYGCSKDIKHMNLLWHIYTRHTTPMLSDRITEYATNRFLTEVNTSYVLDVVHIHQGYEM